MRACVVAVLKLIQISVYQVNVKLTKTAAAAPTVVAIMKAATMLPILNIRASYEAILSAQWGRLP